MNKSAIASLFVFVLFLSACSLKEAKDTVEGKWVFSKEISIEGVSPIGIAIDRKSIWLSDVENNRILNIDYHGELIQEYHGIERPMHLSLHNDVLYIPEYASDTLRMLINGNISFFPLVENLDGIGGVSFHNNLLAVTDFYNHRVITQKGDLITIIGNEGHNDGELYYPTDIEIYDDLIYVADAYNNRIQVFDFAGNYVKMIGWNENIKVATGLKVSDTQVLVTDFEGNRILIYSHEGELIQILSKNLQNPTDIEIIDDFMYVVNYSGESIALYQFLAI